MGEPTTTAADSNKYDGSLDAIEREQGRAVGKLLKQRHLVLDQLDYCPVIVGYLADLGVERRLLVRAVRYAFLYLIRDIRKELQHVEDMLADFDSSPTTEGREIRSKHLHKAVELLHLAEYADLNGKRYHEVVSMLDAIFREVALFKRDDADEHEMVTAIRKALPLDALNTEPGSDEG